MLFWLQEGNSDSLVRQIARLQAAHAAAVVKLQVGRDTTSHVDSMLLLPNPNVK